MTVFFHSLLFLLFQAEVIVIFFFNNFYIKPIQMATYRDFYTKTTNMVTYQNPGRVTKPKILTQTSLDPDLINGKFENNIKIRKDKLNNHFQVDSEEYLEFIKRTDKLSKVLHDKFFKDQKINVDHMEDVYNQLIKSCYLIDYCPNQLNIVSKKTLGRIRANERIKINDKLWPYPYTTFQSSYRNVIDGLKDIGISIKRMESANPRKKVDPLIKAFQEIFKFGKTTYQTEICTLSGINLKRLLEHKKILPEPIDRYTVL